MTSKPKPGTPAHDLSAALGSTDPAEKLEAVERLRARLIEEEHEAVFTMRHRGDSWQAIADATGMNSRQAAQHRYDRSAGLIDRLAQASDRA